MKVSDKSKLRRLLTELIDEPYWDADSPAWASLVEARRQVEINLRIAGVTPGEEEARPAARFTHADIDFWLPDLGGRVDSLTAEVSDFRKSKHELARKTARLERLMGALLDDAGKAE